MGKLVLDLENNRKLHGDQLPICVLTHNAMKGKLCFVYQMHFTREQTAKQMRQKEVYE